MESDLIEIILASSEDYQIDRILLEPDSVLGQDKSYVQSLS